MLPFTIDADETFPYDNGDWVFVPDVRAAVESGQTDIPAKAVTEKGVFDLTLHLAGLTADEKDIILRGCLMNWYREGRK